VLLGGLVLVATGVALTIRAELGVAPYDVLTTGLRDLLDIPIGLAAVVLPAVFMGLGLLLGGRAGVGSLLAVALVGPMLGLVLDRLPDLDAMAPRLVCFGVGFGAITLGIALVVVPEIGPGPAELLMLAIHERGHALAPVRTGIELASVGVGWAMGGQVGAGTIVFTVLIGPALRRALEALGYDTRRAVVASDAAAPGA
jgi:uncharacterized membrane protein YczE